MHFKLGSVKSCDDSKLTSISEQLETVDWLLFSRWYFCWRFRDVFPEKQIKGFSFLVLEEIAGSRLNLLDVDLGFYPRNFAAEAQNYKFTFWNFLKITISNEIWEFFTIAKLHFHRKWTSEKINSENQVWFVKAFQLSIHKFSIQMSTPQTLSNFQNLWYLPSFSSCGLIIFVKIVWKTLIDHFVGTKAPSKLDILLKIWFLTIFTLKTVNSFASFTFVKAQNFFNLSFATSKEFLDLSCHFLEKSIRFLLLISGLKTAFYCWKRNQRMWITRQVLMLWRNWNNSSCWLQIRTRKFLCLHVKKFNWRGEPAKIYI